MFSDRVGPDTFGEYSANIRIVPDRTPPVRRIFGEDSANVRLVPVRTGAVPNFLRRIFAEYSADLNLPKRGGLEKFVGEKKISQFFFWHQHTWAGHHPSLGTRQREVRQHRARTPLPVTVFLCPFIMAEHIRLPLMEVLNKNHRNYKCRCTGGLRHCP